jgi:hypothetical protein
VTRSTLFSSASPTHSQIVPYMFPNASPQGGQENRAFLKDGAGQSSPLEATRERARLAVPLAVERCVPDTPKATPRGRPWMTHTKACELLGLSPPPNTYHREAGAEQQ